LLNQYVGFGNKAVNKTGVVDYYFTLEFYVAFGLFNTEYITKKRKPKWLTLAFFISFPCPFLSELSGGFSAFDV
jgi:hypothetical protein